MQRITCLAGVEDAALALIESVLVAAHIAPSTCRCGLDVATIARCKPNVLICDVDRLDVDPLEMIRRIRFVLPDAVIAVFTKVRNRKWLVACHLAGANCMLSKRSTSAELALGIRRALQFGCYTDERFARA